LDVIIGNRYFQLTFEVEPFAPNIGISHLRNPENGGGGDHGKKSPKDTEMEEAKEKENLSMPEASNDRAMDNNQVSKDSEAQMDFDWSNDVSLGKEYELTQAARELVGVPNGVPVKVTNATVLGNASSALARLGNKLQRTRPAVSATNSTQDSIGSSKGGNLGSAQPDVAATTVAASGLHVNQQAARL
jgi:hypothetical protein